MTSHLSSASTTTPESAAAPVVIVTGATSGIGHAAAFQLAARGVVVVMACRDLDRGGEAREKIAASTANPEVHCLEIDLSSLPSIERFARVAGERWPQIHALINNAARFDLSQKAPLPTDEGIEVVWATNFLGPWYLTEQLLPRLRHPERPGRIINVSTQGLRAHPFLQVNIEAARGAPRSRRRTFSASRAYYQSKLALLTHTIDLARREDPSAVVVNAAWVPAVKLDRSRTEDLSAWLRSVYRLKRRLSISPDVMARAYVALALDSLWGERTGALVDQHQREARPPQQALDRGVAEALDGWARSTVRRWASA